jgi:hypothetical protein
MTARQLLVRLQGLPVWQHESKPRHCGFAGKVCSKLRSVCSRLNDS